MFRKLIFKIIFGVCPPNQRFNWQVLEIDNGTIVLGGYLLEDRRREPRERHSRHQRQHSLCCNQKSRRRVGTQPSTNFQRSLDEIRPPVRQEE